jgi:hypothetical protein
VGGNIASLSTEERKAEIKSAEENRIKYVFVIINNEQTEELVDLMLWYC